MTDQFSAELSYNINSITVFQYCLYGNRLKFIGFRGSENISVLVMRDDCKDCSRKLMLYKCVCRRIDSGCWCFKTSMDSHPNPNVYFVIL